MYSSICDQSLQSWPNGDSFTIGSLNINSLISKISDLSVILDNDGCAFDIFGISESRCHSNQPLSILNIPQYHNPVLSYMSDNSNIHRVGLALYIKNDINFVRRDDLESPNIECIWIQFKVNNQKVLLGQLYRHPSSTNSWFDDFVEMMDSVYYENCSIFLIGDFNIDLISKQGYAKKWISIFQSYQLCQLITLPTHILPGKNSTLIDHIYSNSSHLIHSTYVPMCGVSDHYPVACSLLCGRRRSGFKTHKYVSYRSMKKFNKDSFLLDLANASFDNILSSDSPDEALFTFVDTFMNLVNKHAPIKKKRIKSYVKCPWLSVDIINKMRLRDGIDKKINHEEYRILRNEVKSDIRRAKKVYFESLIRDRSDSASIWKAINILKKGIKSKSSVNLDPNNLNKFFSNVVNDMLGSTYGEDCLQEDVSSDFDKVKDFVSSKLKFGEQFDIPLMTSREVLDHLESLKTKKAVGIDGISPYFIKLAAPFIHIPLTYLYNLCISKGIVPSAFKSGKVIPIHKKGSLDDMNNYRPITVLSVLTKPLEKHIQSNLMQFFEMHKLFNPHQSAFRRFHSCESAALRITEKYLNAFNNSELCGAVFIDFSKAFDTINHDILLYKLKLYGFSGTSLDFFTSYLTGRSQSVSIQSELSQSLPVHCGVPQGSILGPILFCIFINDLPLHIENCDCDLFADDTTMGSSGPDLDTIEHKLTIDMGNVVKWCRINHMLINFQKTTCMLLCSRQKRQRLSRSNLNIEINIHDSSVILPQVNCQKLLGIIIDHNLTFADHVDYVSKKLSTSIFQMNCLKHFLDKRTLKLFYFGHVQPHIDYCSSIWGHCCDSYKKHLSSLQRRAIKLILNINVPRGSNIDNLFKELHILPLEKRFNYNDSVLVFKIFHNLSPGYLNNILSQKLYFIDDIRFHMPKTKLDIFKMSFSYQGPRSWNDLPHTIRNTDNLMRFKRILSDYINSS